MARFEFTMVSDAMLQGLEEAGATGTEMRAYVMLIRGLPKDRSNAECWMPADMAETKVGMRPDVFTRALRALCVKAVTTSEGKRAPILTKVSRGCRGHCPHYEDTLGRLIAGGEYPPAIARQPCHAMAAPIGDPTGSPINEPIGDPERTPKQEGNGRQKQAPFAEFSTSDCKAKTDQLQGKNGPIARQTCPPIETIQDIQLVGGAAPPAQRGAAVRQPHKQNRDASRVVTGTDPGRAPAGAGRGRPAAALTSWAEPERMDPDQRRRHAELARRIDERVAATGDYEGALTPQELEEFRELEQICRRSAVAE